jgi:hypothetical protein
MGQRNNIIKALGPHNVIYADGKNQYWMDNFIEVFRGRHMYLILNYEKEDTSSDRRRASAEIALYNYMSSKSHRW